MKLQIFAMPLLAVSLAMSPVIAAADESLSPADQAAQDFNDSQFCAALLEKLGGADNLQKSQRALAHAKQLAPIVGQTTEAEFSASYRDTKLILDMADANEMKQFTKFCLAKW